METASEKGGLRQGIVLPVQEEKGGGAWQGTVVGKRELATL